MAKTEKPGTLVLTKGNRIMFLTDPTKKQRKRLKKKSWEEMDVKDFRDRLNEALGEPAKT